MTNDPNGWTPRCFLCNYISMTRSQAKQLFMNIITRWSINLFLNLILLAAGAPVQTHKARITITWFLRFYDSHSRCAS